MPVFITIGMYIFIRSWNKIQVETFSVVATSQENAQPIQKLPIEIGICPFPNFINRQRMPGITKATIYELQFAIHQNFKYLC